MGRRPAEVAPGSVERDCDDETTTTAEGQRRLEARAAYRRDRLEGGAVRPRLGPPVGDLGRAVPAHVRRRAARVPGDGERRRLGRPADPRRAERAVGDAAVGKRRHRGVPTGGRHRRGLRPPLRDRVEQQHDWVAVRTRPAALVGIEPSHCHDRPVGGSVCG